MELRSVLDHSIVFHHWKENGILGKKCPFSVSCIQETGFKKQAFFSKSNVELCCLRRTQPAYTTQYNPHHTQFNPENGGSMFLQSASFCLKDYSGHQHKRPQFELLLP
jgi:hypothetical protein